MKAVKPRSAAPARKTTVLGADAKRFRALPSRVQSLTILNLLGDCRKLLDLQLNQPIDHAQRTVTHAALVAASPVRLTVQSEPIKSKFTGKPDYVLVTIDGHNHALDLPHAAYRRAFAGRRGCELLVAATGAGKSVRVKVELAPVTVTLPPRFGARMFREARRLNIPPDRFAVLALEDLMNETEPSDVSGFTQNKEIEQLAILTAGSSEQVRAVARKVFPAMGEAQLKSYHRDFMRHWDTWGEPETTSNQHTVARRGKGAK